MSRRPAIRSLMGRVELSYSSPVPAACVSSGGTRQSFRRESTPWSRVGTPPQPLGTHHTLYGGLHGYNDGTGIQDRRGSGPDGGTAPGPSEAAPDYDPGRGNRHLAGRRQEAEDSPAAQSGGDRRSQWRLLGN